MNPATLQTIQKSGAIAHSHPLSLAKRALDIGLAGAGLLASLPLWAVIAVAIKWQDDGPVFFRDRRVGRGGHEFKVFKFRTMVPNADQIFGAKQATEHDPRITRIGRILRNTAMDELPQLWNIFKGDMSFVGPRALRPGEVHARGDGHFIPLERIPGHRERHAVPPGLTGVAQIYADRDVSPRQKFRYDLLYIKAPELLARPPPDCLILLDYFPWEVGNAGREIVI